MKKLYFLNEEEKQRILNMHKDATKRNYLTENYNKQLLLESWADARKGIVDFFKKLSLIIRRGIPKSLGNINAAKKSLLATLKEGKILDNQGFYYALYKQSDTKYIIRKYDFDGFLDDNLKNWVKDKDFSRKKVEELIAEDITKESSPFFITTEMFDRIEKDIEGSDYVITVVRDLTGLKVNKVNSFETIDFKYDNFSMAKEASDLVNQIKNRKSNIRRIRTNSLWVTIPTLLYTGYWLILLKGTINVGREMLKNNKGVSADLAGITDDVNTFINDTCKIIEKYEDNTVYAEYNFDTKSKSLFDLISSPSQLRKEFEKMEMGFLHQLMYEYKKTYNKCFLTDLFQRMDNDYNLFKNNVQTPIQNIAKKDVKIKEAELNSEEFFKKLKGKNLDTGKSISDLSNFNVEKYKERFLKNCPCKLYEYIQSYMGDPILLLSFDGNEVEKTSTGTEKKSKFTEIVIVNSDKSKVISSFCNEFDYNDLRDAKNTYDKAKNGMINIDKNKMIQNDDDAKKIKAYDDATDKFNKFVGLVGNQKTIDCK